MRNMKKFLLIIVLALSMGLYGCTVKPHELLWGRSRETEREVVSAMQDYLIEKYDVVFYDIVSFWAAGWNYDYDILNLSTEIDGVEESFSVERHKTETGYEFKDNYFGLVIRSSFEAKVSALAAEYFEEYHVYAILRQNYPDNLTKPTQLDDLLALDDRDSIAIIVTVENRFSNMEEFESIAKSFVDQWSKEEIRSKVRVICLSKEVYQTIDRSNYSTVYSEDVKLAEYREILTF